MRLCEHLNVLHASRHAVELVRGHYHHNSPAYWISAKFENARISDESRLPLQSMYAADLTPST